MIKKIMVAILAHTNGEKYADLYKVSRSLGYTNIYELIPKLRRMENLGLIGWSISPSYIYLKEDWIENYRRITI